MGIMDELEEVKKQISEEEVESISEESQLEHVEEDDEEPKEVSVKEKNVSGYEMRKDRESEKKMKEMQEQLAAERAARMALERIVPRSEEKKEQVQQRPDPNEDPDGARDYDFQMMRQELQQMKLRNAVQEATRELSSGVEELTKTTPHAKEVIEYGYQALCADIKERNPSASKAQIEEAAQLRILQQAAAYERAGINPALGLMVEMQTKTGYKPKVEEKKDVEKVDEGKRISSVIKNKAKSGSPLQGGGSNAKTTKTVAELVGITPRQYMELSKEDKALYDTLQ